jgi:SpoVK/Ycf46/Vps4 family AAA+-type ATPase
MVKRLYIPLPNRVGRTELINSLLGSNCAATTNLSQDDYDQIVEATKGYSGADLKELCKEAAMLPLREIRDIRTITESQIRPIVLQDLLTSLKQVRPTVSKEDLGRLLDWNE